ncbi:MAG TPA: DUF2157 domain-containing protein [Ferruginibacter sp.]|jgi:hypothetical protein|nr:DUF2157 domain-containing protein [Ferruginibacter sp.]
MNIPLFEKLHREGLISSASLEKAKSDPSNKLFSLHWEIKTLLYLGVLLLTSGLGILVYKNIDTIGHQAILAFILAVSLGSFAYCFNKKLPFATEKVASTNPFFDYILLLACLTFIIFIGYIQYEYKIFGERYGLATFFPMAVLFFSAYYFDHLGILSLAITNLGAWLGLTVTPLKLYQSNDFNSTPIIITGLLLSVFLFVMEQVTIKKNIKKHFAFTYANFGLHILFVSCLAALVKFDTTYLLWFLLLLVIAYVLYRRSLLQRSFYFIVFITLYSYIGLSYVVVRLLSSIPYSSGIGSGVIMLGFFYFIFSGIGLIVFLIHTNRKIKNHDSL